MCVALFWVVKLTFKQQHLPKTKIRTTFLFLHFYFRFRVACFFRCCRWLFIIFSLSRLAFSLCFCSGSRSAFCWTTLLRASPSLDVFISFNSRSLDCSLLFFVFGCLCVFSLECFVISSRQFVECRICRQQSWLFYCPTLTSLYAHTHSYIHTVSICVLPSKFITLTCVVAKHSCV